MKRPFRRVLTGAAVSLGLAVGVAVPADAQALPLEFDVTATVFIASLGIENTVEGGTFVGEVDLGTGELVADLDLPASETRIGDFMGLTLASVGFATVPTGPTTGQVDLEAGTISTVNEFDIHITHVSPLGVSFFNLVGNNCMTSSPITIETEGDLDLEGGVAIEAEFTIPRFENCGLLTTPLLNLLVPGEGNSFTASLE